MKSRQNIVVGTVLARSYWESFWVWVCSVSGSCRAEASEPINGQDNSNTNGCCKRSIFPRFPAWLLFVTFNMDAHFNLYFVSCQLRRCSEVCQIPPEAAKIEIWRKSRFWKSRKQHWISRFRDQYKQNGFIVCLNDFESLCRYWLRSLIFLILMFTLETWHHQPRSVCS